MWNLFKKTVKEKVKDKFIYLNEEFLAQYNTYKGKFIFDEELSVWILNHYVPIIVDGEKIVKSLVLKKSEGKKTIQVIVEGEELHRLIENNWQWFRECYEREFKIKIALASFGFSLKKENTITYTIDKPSKKAKERKQNTTL